MSRVTIAPEHKKFFQLNGYITLEGLLTADEVKELAQEVKKHRSELPGLLIENFPGALPIARKQGAIAAALLDRKPLYLTYDCVLDDLEEMPTLEDREIALLLPLSGPRAGEGLFMIDRSHLYKERKACYLLLIFTANFSTNPIVYQ